MSSSVAVQTSSTPPKKKSSWMRYAQVVAFVGIIGGIYLSFAGNVLSTTPGVPALIGNFSLSHVEAGEKALAEIRDLYGEDITYAKAFVAHYKGDGGGVTIRAGEKREVSDAGGAINAIVTAMDKGEKKDYSDLKRINVNGLVVYALKVKGMPFYLYQLNNKVMWVDIMEGDPNQVLTDAIRAYKE